MISMALSFLVAITLAIIALWYDFNSWKRFGTGGTPPTLKGYFKIRRWGLYLLFRNQHPNLLDASSIPNEGPSFLNLDKFPQRYGSRPENTRWTLPQRQQPGSITPVARSRLADMMQEFASSSAYSHYIYTAASKTEGGTGPALYIHPSSSLTMNPNAGKIFYEIAHVHPSEQSLHVYLSPRDARIVVEKGWAQRFSVPWLAPSSWVHVYAPRDEEEVEIVRDIVRAGVCFAVGKDVR